MEAFLRLCQPPLPKFLAPRNPYPWARRVNGAHSLLRSFICPPPPSLFLVSTLLSAPLARARPLLLHKINEKKTSFDRSFSLRFLLSTRFYSIPFPKPLEIFLKFLATVCWYKLLVHLPVLIVRILKKFSKFALAISHPSRNASKATSVAIVLRAIVFLFFFFLAATIAAFVPVPLHCSSDVRFVQGRGTVDTRY